MRVAMVVSFVLLSSGASLANEAGKFGRSGESGFTCNSCHTGATPPTVAVDGLQTSYDAGDSAVFTITITSNEANTTNRVVGFNAAVDDGAGSFVDVDDATRTNNANLNNEITHDGPQDFASGSLSMDVQFDIAADAFTGTYTLYVAANDADGNGDDDDGDDVRASTVTFTINGTDPPPGEGEGEGSPAPGGEGEGEGEPAGGCNCDASTLSPAAAPLLVTALFLLRRRRR